MLFGVRPFRLTNLTQNTTRMSENVQTKAKPTLGLTGLTVNAMAPIAPGAFLWSTHGEQCLYGQPMAEIAMIPAPSFGRCVSSQTKKPKGTKQEPKKI